MTIIISTVLPPCFFAKVGDEETALAHLRRATDNASATKDSMLSLIDHMLDEAAITYIELGRFQDAIDTVSPGNRYVR